MKEFEYTVQDQLGIHARPAGQIAKLAKAHPDCEISFAKIGGSKTANAAPCDGTDEPWCKARGCTAHHGRRCQ